MLDLKRSKTTKALSDLPSDRVTLTDWLDLIWDVLSIILLL